MKTIALISLLAGLVPAAGTLSAAAPATATVPAPSPPAARIGVYDSRAVAFAFFWNPDQRAKLDGQIAAAQAAKASGDTKRFKELEPAIKNYRKNAHLQVFSTAPADEAMAALAPRLPALLSELGVARLVSKWDAKALRAAKSAERIDVTDRLVRVFIEPTANQQKTLDSLKTVEPLPLWKARLMIAFGDM